MVHDASRGLELGIPFTYLEGYSRICIFPFHQIDQALKKPQQVSSGKIASLEDSLVRKIQCSGIFQNAYCFLPTAWSIGKFSPVITVRTLMEPPEVNSPKCVSLPQDWGLSGLFILSLINKFQSLFPSLGIGSCRGFSSCKLWFFVFASRQFVSPNSGAVVCLVNSLPKGSRKSYWFSVCWAFYLLLGWSGNFSFQTGNWTILFDF